MKSTKILTAIIVAAIGMTLLVGCGSDPQSGTQKDNTNNKMSPSEIERLPEAQKDSELDNKLAEMRKFRKDNSKTVDGVQIDIHQNDSDLPGQTKNRPDFNMDESLFEFLNDYLENEIKIPRRTYGYDVTQCIDPRMNAIYDDDDKGVAAGYENQNILLMEYETSEDSVYSYLVLVRESKESSWKVIHDGLSYKE